MITLMYCNILWKFKHYAEKDLGYITFTNDGELIWGKMVMEPIRIYGIIGNAFNKLYRFTGGKEYNTKVLSGSVMKPSTIYWESITPVEPKDKRKGFELYLNGIRWKLVGKSSIDSPIIFDGRLYFMRGIWKATEIG